TWVSRLPENPLGRRVAAHARANGVGTSHVDWTTDGRLGLLFVEVGQRPRPTASLYDRADSAFPNLDPPAFHLPPPLAGARPPPTSGIPPAPPATGEQATIEALKAARNSGCHTSFDVNYRALLTTPGQARATITKLAPYIDTLIASAGEAEAVFSLTG